MFTEDELPSWLLVLYLTLVTVYCPLLVYLAISSIFALLAVCYANPMKLLRTPKIYNALITTKQNLLPSEAFPASTGQIFEPIGLPAEPVLLNPEAFARARVDGEEANATRLDDQPRPFSKMPQPIVFYPRYNVYHQYPSPLYPFSNVFQEPIIYGKEVNNESQEPLPDGPDASAVSEDSANAGFVTNNNPKNSDIPNVPPPPPPQGAPRPGKLM